MADKVVTIEKRDLKWVHSVPARGSYTRVIGKVLGKRGSNSDTDNKQ